MGLKFLIVSSLLLVSTLAYSHDGEEHNRVKPAGCEDFHGTWKGECINENKKITYHTIKINQKSCTRYNLDGMELPIDGVKQTIETTKAGQSTLTISLKWNKEKTELIGKTTSMSTEFNEKPTFFNKVDWRVRKVANGERIEFIQSGMIEVGKYTQKIVANCNYGKVN